MRYKFKNNKNYLIRMLCLLLASFTASTFLFACSSEKAEADIAATAALQEDKFIRPSAKNIKESASDFIENGVDEANTRTEAEASRKGQYEERGESADAEDEMIDELPVDDFPEFAGIVEDEADSEAAVGDPIRILYKKHEPEHIYQTFEASLRAINSLIYQGLFRLDRGLSLEKELLESYVWSEDRMTLTLHLKDDVYFSDGKKLDSEDVIASLILYRYFFLRYFYDLDSDFSEVTPDIDDRSPLLKDIYYDINGSDNEYRTAYFPVPDDLKKLYASAPKVQNSNIAFDQDLLLLRKTVAEGRQDDAAKLIPRVQCDDAADFPELADLIYASPEEAGQLPVEKERSSEKKSEKPEGEDEEQSEAAEKKANEAKRENEFIPEAPQNAAKNPAEYVLYTDKAGHTAFRSIKAVNKGPSGSIQIKLSRRADHLIWYLRFAIIPKEYARFDYLDLPPGTGDFVLSTKNLSDGAELQAKDKNTTKIILKEYTYDNEKSALLDRGAADLAYFNRSEYTSAATRRDFKANGFMSMTYYSLYASEEFLERCDRRNLSPYLRKFLMASSSSWGKAAGEDAVIPLYPGSPGWSHLKPAYEKAFLSRSRDINPEHIKDAFKAGLGRVRFIAPDLPECQTIMKKILIDMIKSGADAYCRFLPYEEYMQSLKSRKYDMALCMNFVSHPVNPVSYLSADCFNIKGDDAFSYHGKAISAGLYSKEASDTFCKIEDDFEYSPKKVNELSFAIADFYNNLPIFGLGFAKEGAVSGPYCEGTLSPGPDRPYQGIEKLKTRYPNS